MGRSSRAESPKTRPTWETLETWVRGKVQEFVQELLEVEVTELLGRQRHERRAGVDAPVGYRNGYGKPRRLAVQTGTIVLRRPRVRGLEEQFESRVLPLFARRTEQVADLLPELYLHGLAQGDFELALRGLLGDGAPLSAKSIERLRAKFVVDYQAWRTRSLAEHELVYAWADGIYVRAGLEREKAALLVVIGALRDGRKEVLAVVPGYRESTDSWRSVLRDLRERGLQVPKLLVADGAAGIWAAVAELWPAAAEQRCWNHKIVNVLTQLPKKMHPAAREALAAIPYAPTRAEAERRRDAFAKTYRRAYPRAVAILETDWERLVTFYDFPDGHWKHLRTTNVIESPFAAVRLRTDAAKRFKKVENATALLWRLLMVAEQRFRRLDAPEQLAAVYDGRQFEDGKLVKAKQPVKAAA
jgi:putative transposase